MCMGLPMQVVETGFGFAHCDYNGQRRTIDTMLVGGEVLVGSWLLVFIDAAREIISQEDACKIKDALSAVEAAMTGGDVDQFFADLAPSSLPQK